MDTATLRNQAAIEALLQQRNDALNAVVHLRAENAVLSARLDEREASRDGPALVPVDPHRPSGEPVALDPSPEGVMSSRQRRTTT